MIDLKALFRCAQLFSGKPFILISDMLIMYWMVFVCATSGFRARPALSGIFLSTLCSKAYQYKDST